MNILHAVQARPDQWIIRQHRIVDSDGAYDYVEMEPAVMVLIVGDQDGTRLLAVGESDAAASSDSLENLFECSVWGDLFSWPDKEIGPQHSRQAARALKPCKNCGQEFETISDGSYWMLTHKKGCLSPKT